MLTTVAIRALMAAALVVAIPAAATAQAEAPELEDTRWHLVAYDDGGQELSDVPWDLAATLTFDAGEAYGSTGCNHWGATYELGRQEAIAFARAGVVTDVGCADEHLDAQTAFMTALPNTVSWTIDTGTTSERRLILFDADGGHILEFTSDDRSLIARQVRALTALVETQQAQIKSLRERIKELERTS